MRAVVVALGKVGLPLAARIALAGHEVVGCDVDPRVVDAVNAGEPPFPNEAGPARGAGRDRRRRAPARRQPTRPPPSPRAPTSSSPSRRWSSTRARGPTGAILDAVVDDIGRGLQAGHHRLDRDHRPRRHDPRRASRRRWPRAAACAARTSSTPSSAPSASSAAGRSRTSTSTPSWSAASATPASAAASSCTPRSCDAEVRGLGSAEAAELSKLAETTYRDINIAFANELARYADRLGHRRAVGHRRGQLAALLARPPAGHRGRRPLHPGLPALPAGRRRRRAPAASPRARSTSRCRPTRPACSATWPARRVLILGVAYRGGVKETAFSRRVRAARRAGRPRRRGGRRRPAVRRRRARARWASPRGTATSAVDAAVVQADHGEYADAGAPPTCRASPRSSTAAAMLDPARFDGVPVRRIGRPEGAAQDPGSPIAATTRSPARPSP